MAWQASWDAGTHLLTWAASPGITASPSTSFNVLTGVTAISPRVFWAAGIEDNSTFVDQTLTEVYCGLRLSLTAPATALAGVPFSLTVEAKNIGGSPASGYRGTVHFTSSDSGATLPADYTFTLGDAGTRVFSGVVLRSPYNQPSTITVSDLATPFVSDTASITVSCAGACQSSAGTPGGRGVTDPASSGLPPGSRDANVAPSATPPLRLPRTQPHAVSPAARASAGTAAVRSAEPLRIPVQAPAQVLAQAEPAVVLAAPVSAASVAAKAPASPEPDRTPWYLLLVAPLLLTGVALGRLFRRARS